MGGAWHAGNNSVADVTPLKQSEPGSSIGRMNNTIDSEVEISKAVRRNLGDGYLGAFEEGRACKKKSQEVVESISESRQGFWSGSHKKVGAHQA